MKDVRPTSDKVIQAVFNVLAMDMKGAAFLDLFCGSGRVGLYAHRLGADVTAVECVPARVSAVKKTAPPERYRIFCADVRRATTRLLKDEVKFSVIFADPPYGMGWVSRIMEMSEVWQNLLTPSGVFVLEHTKREPIEAADFMEISEKQYGDTIVSFIRPRHRE